MILCQQLLTVNHMYNFQSMWKICRWTKTFHGENIRQLSKQKSRKTKILSGKNTRYYIRPSNRTTKPKILDITYDRTTERPNQNEKSLKFQTSTKTRALPKMASRLPLRVLNLLILRMARLLAIFPLQVFVFDQPTEQRPTNDRPTKRPNRKYSILHTNHLAIDVYTRQSLRTDCGMLIQDCSNILKLASVSRVGYWCTKQLNWFYSAEYVEWTPMHKV